LVGGFWDLGHAAWVVVLGSWTGPSWLGFPDCGCERSWWLHLLDVVHGWCLVAVFACVLACLLHCFLDNFWIDTPFYM
jgi:hypothetical protein